ncbi:hypothetical protein [Labrys sp. ZIDIC5]|uniref:hypothetical protein n=1 Tax=Labrys sedimenti TaxID=3106036 RepID=UPI002ACB029F|nr:hypothetical protein [Labrys sp. ZIDIC5]MDZ5448928.1 hypothetical protein [Labrys sp. ZIDIC5]
MIRLSERELRSLVLLSKKAAHELQDKPLVVLLRLKETGLCQVTSYYQDMSRSRKKVWNCQVVEITPAGLDYLRSVGALQ